MRRKVTITLLAASLLLSIWIVIDPHAPLHDPMSHYSAADIAGQAAFGICLIFFSFGIGKLFRK